MPISPAGVPHAIGDCPCLRPQTDADDYPAAQALAGSLADHGELDESEQILRRRPTTATSCR